MKVQALRRVGTCVCLSCQLLSLPTVPITWLHAFGGRGGSGEWPEVMGPLLDPHERSMAWLRTDTSGLLHHHP